MRFIVDLVARRGSPETGGELTTRNHRVPTRRPSRGAPGFSGDVGNGRRMEARQGAIRVFSGNCIVFRSTPQPTIPASPDARSRGPSPRATAAGTRRPLAIRDSERSRIRCSWRLGPVRFRQALPPADDGDEHEDEHKGFPQKIKKCGWPACRASLPVPTLGSARSAPQPTIPASPDARSREPSPGMTAAGTRRPSRARRLYKIAHQVVVTAVSGALPAGIAAGG